MMFPPNFLHNRLSAHYIEINSIFFYEMLRKYIAARKESFGNRVITKLRDLKNFPLTPDELSKYDAIIVDPPRSGAKLQFLNIARSNVSTIISISCNVNTFARDAKILIESNYELKWVQPIDQFLFSAHVELVAIFRLKYKNANKKIYNYKKT